MRPAYAAFFRDGQQNKPEGAGMLSQGGIVAF